MQKRKALHNIISLIMLFTLIVLSVLCTGCGTGQGEAASSDAAGGETAQSGEEAVPEYTEFSELNGKTVSMLTGVPFEDLVRNRAPEVEEFTYFNNTPDMILALKSGKTDAILVNSATAALAVNKNDDLAIFPEKVQEETMGFAFAKGSPETAKWQAAFDTISEEEKKAAWDKWTGPDEEAKVLPAQDWPGKNGTVKVAACDTLEPMCYTGEDGVLLGFDIEIILMIAEKLDVHVEFTGMEFSSVLASVQSGKALLGAGSIFITEERKASVDFVEYYPSGFDLVVRDVSTGEGTSFVSAMKESFEKTFLRENRYRMFLSGIGTTLIIVVLSALFGTLLGFLVFLACRHGNKIANRLSRFFHWLVSGMPVVVLLMIMYYVVFGSFNISGTVVSIISFTLVFGAEVYAMMTTAVGAVDGGQMEAAYALGYTDRMAFFRHILPQAMPHFLPPYRGSLVNLIKATAVVGYIAVQDLTKMGDLVRSRTYEAFFPLIAVAIIYFILAGVLVFLLKRVTLRWNPTGRTKEKILKGVNPHD